MTAADFAELPPATAPHGPHAARQVAVAIAATGAHSDLVADGEHTCLRGGCPTIPILDGAQGR